MKKLAFIFCVFIGTQFCSCTRRYSQPNITETTEERATISDGYSTITEKNKTGAGNSVENSKAILKLDDHLRALAGVVVSGSGSGASVTIRGINSFHTSSTEPLFILNGTPMSNYASTFMAVNPIDIKRVTVLLDAASTGIYGVRGANGVIIVTLKNAK